MHFTLFRGGSFFLLLVTIFLGIFFYEDSVESKSLVKRSPSSGPSFFDLLQRINAEAALLKASNRLAIAERAFGGPSSSSAQQRNLVVNSARRLRRLLLIAERNLESGSPFEYEGQTYNLDQGMGEENLGGGEEEEEPQEEPEEEPENYE